VSTNNFKLQLQSLPKSPIDFNFICAASYAEYKMLLILASALMLPLSFVHSNMQNAINNINTESYKLLKKGLDDVNGTLKGILKTPIKDLKNISADLGNFGNALSHTCEFFMSTLPEPMFNIFQDLQYGLMDITNGLIKLPNSITNSIMNSLMGFKMDALSSVLGTLYGTVLTPFLAYENFLKENGIVKIIDTMYKMEVCMMKPGICHRDPSYFMEPTTKKTYSAYYKNQFFINSKGSINFNLLATTKDQATKSSVVHQNLMSYIKY
jgi:hypothetical protein